MTVHTFCFRYSSSHTNFKRQSVDCEMSWQPRYQVFAYPRSIQQLGKIILPQLTINVDAADITRRCILCAHHLLPELREAQRFRLCVICDKILHNLSNAIVRLPLPILYARSSDLHDPAAAIIRLDSLINNCALTSSADLVPANAANGISLCIAHLTFVSRNVSESDLHTPDAFCSSTEPLSRCQYSAGTTTPGIASDAFRCKRH